MEHFDTIADPTGLRLRTAAALLGQATGPFRVQRRTWLSEVERLAQLAKEWVYPARRYG